MVSLTHTLFNYTTYELPVQRRSLVKCLQTAELNGCFSYFRNVAESWGSLSLNTKYFEAMDAADSAATLVPGVSAQFYWSSLSWSLVSPNTDDVIWISSVSAHAQLRIMHLSLNPVAVNSILWVRHQVRRSWPPRNRTTASCSVEEQLFIFAVPLPWRTETRIEGRSWVMDLSKTWRGWI